MRSHNLSKFKRSFKKFFKIKGGISAGTLYVLVFFSILVGGAMMFSGDSTVSRISKGTQIVTPGFVTTEPAKNNIQLYTFKPIIPTPVPTTNYCPPDTTKKPGCTCVPYEAMTATCEETCTKNSDCSKKGGTCFSGSPGLLPGFTSPSDTSGTSYCQYIYFNGAPERTDPYFDTPKCQTQCVGKPVIYLYPERDTLVDVRLTIPGTIVESDPLYPQDGWRNVLAHPSGELEYLGQNYRELYYETEVDKLNQPAQGMVIATSNLKMELTNITTQLGLIPVEQQEFLDYWLPKLYDLHAPYILFSLIDPAEKERIDHVDISPKPDTFIGFLAYFKPLSAPTTSLPSLQLPQNPPDRIGFTAVEWGGTIGYE